MPGSRIGAGRDRLSGVPGQLDRVTRHFLFGHPAVLRDLLHDMAVAIAGGELHPPVHPARIVAQDPLDHAHGLDELAPVHRTQGAQTADAVADGDLIGGLLLVLDLDQLLDRQAGLGELLLDPGQRQGQGGTLALKTARQLRDEGAGHGRIRARHVRDHQDQILGVALGHRRHLVGPAVGQILVGAAGGDPDRDAAQILDQREPQHDRDGPQLTQLEGGDGLIGGDETVEVLGVHPAIAVGDDLQRQVIDPWQAGRGTMAQARQFPAVALGQMPLGGADLILDQIEVIEQPFPGRRDPAVLRDRDHEQPADADQDGFIVLEASQQAIRRVSGHQEVRVGEPLAVLFHLYGAEEFGAQRRFVAAIARGQTVSRAPVPPLEQGFAHRQIALPHLCGLRRRRILCLERMPGDRFLATRSPVISSKDP